MYVLLTLLISLAHSPCHMSACRVLQVMELCPIILLFLVCAEMLITVLTQFSRVPMRTQ